MKVTTLIPAYKPKYLGELLTSLRYQTVKPARIVFSDDSPDLAFIHTLNAEPLKSTIADLNIVAVEGPHTGAWANHQHLLKVWGGDTELFHLLLDDDVIYPDFYERHLAAHATSDTLCSVSRRWTALESGQPKDDLKVPEAVSTHPHRLLSLSAKVLFSTTAARTANWLGEFSNAVFRAEFAAELGEAKMDGISYIGLQDLGSFLNASLHKPVSYLNEHLGYFRTSGEQHSANPLGLPMKFAHMAYLGLAIAGRRVGAMTADETATALAALCPLVLQRYGDQADIAVLCAAMPSLARGDAQAEAQFLETWRNFAAT